MQSSLRVQPRGVVRHIRREVRNSRWNADAHLRAHERSVAVHSDGISRIDICQLAANRPIEDFYSAAKCLSSNAFLFGVYDGHGGSACSRHVSTKLFNYICASVLQKHTIADLSVDKRLEWIFSSADVHMTDEIARRFLNNVSKYHTAFQKNTDQSTTVRKALQQAFKAFDEDISKAALPDKDGRVDKGAVMTAASGSCTTLAHVRRRHLHVANIGDAAAVMGVASAGGGVQARQLSKAHCADNMDEVHRLRSEHPVSEERRILQGGRLLGELIPLRAFGDVRYKWPLELQKVVLEPLGSPPPLHLQTPPYLSSAPEVFYHKLTGNDKFLVLATDGLWEWLDADTVVRLVHDHTLGTLTLQPYQPKPGTNLKQVVADLAERRRGEHKKPIDDNCATHLIRHALGGVSGGTKKQYERLNDLLQIPPGMARNYRDDISVIVVHFDDAYLSQPDSETELQ